jgi:pimeloyl-ACP methyl ester carboxylesterase
MLKTLATFTFAATSLLFSANLEAHAQTYVIDQADLPFDALPGTTTTRYWGTNKGSGYKIEVPADWNGSLVVWNHGFRDASNTRLWADPPQFREWLVTNGYAWAVSSYSVNGYDVKTATKDVLDLPSLFTREHGAVTGKTYVAGESMGGHITALAIEKSPGVFDGAMPTCGVLGDYGLFDYFVDISLSGQALAGVQAAFPPDPTQYFGVTIPAVKAALGPSFPFALNATGGDFKNVVEQRSGGDRPVFDQAFLFWNGFVSGDFLFSLGATDGGLPPKLDKNAIDNSDTIYQFDGNPVLTASEAALNDSILRVEQDPGSRHAQVIVDGTIDVPVLTLHGLGDLFVPFSMEKVYATRVAAQGKAHLLVQRAIREQNHCAFTNEELSAGFADLVRWVEDGVKPAGDDVLNSAAVSDPNFGCAFTSEDRVYPAPISIPACP